MCLTTAKPATKTSGIGYKVFEMDPNGKLVGCCYGTTTPKPTRRWLKASRGYAGTLTNPADTLNIGWHIYLRRKDAKQLLETYTRKGMRVLRKVKYRGAHHEGTGDGGWNHRARVVVADEMFIFKGEL
jgi:hypothetical protein